MWVFTERPIALVGAIAGLVSIPGVMFPVFVQLEKEDLKRAFSKVFKYSSILAFPVVFGLLRIGKKLIGFVYGAEYLPAELVLYILSFLILRSALGFWGVIFNAKEKPEYPVYISFFAMTLNIILNYVLILRIGMVGAAIATVISNAFSWLTLAHLSRKLFDVFPEFNHIFKPLIASLVMYFMISHLGLNSLLDGAIVVVSGALIYFTALMVLRGLTKNDIRYIRTVFGF